MRKLACLIALALLAGCIPMPPQIASPPAPPPELIAAQRSVQTRVIQVPIDAVFPRVINVLMDNNFVVRSVDSKLGFVAFVQQWMDDPAKPAASITEEGTLLFTPAAAGSTQVRVLLTGSWRDLAPGGGNYLTRGGAGQMAEEREYRKILDMLQGGLTAQ